MGSNAAQKSVSKSQRERSLSENSYSSSKKTHKSLPRLCETNRKSMHSRILSHEMKTFDKQSDKSRRPVENGRQAVSILPNIKKNRSTENPSGRLTRKKSGLDATRRKLMPCDAPWGSPANTKKIINKCMSQIPTKTIKF